MILRAGSDPADTAMNPVLKRGLVLILGWLFILVGIAGLFLPVLQGILCIVIGLMILSSEYVWARKLLRELKARFPKVAQVSEQASEKAQRWLAKVTKRGNNKQAEKGKGKPAA